MRILVAFKVTPDYEALPRETWAAAGQPVAAGSGPSQQSDGDSRSPLVGLPETRYVRRVLNCFDESALELALRLRDALAGRGEAAALSALTIGGRDAEPYCTTLLALGYERATRVTVESAAADEPPASSEPPAGLDFAPEATAELIAAFVRRVGGCDLLMLGSRSGPGDSGLVPFLAAEALGWPCLSQVVELEPGSEGRLRVAFDLDEGLVRATVRTPCVLTVGNAVVSHLRVPTLRDRLALGDRRAEVTSAAELGLDIGAPARRIGVTLGPEARPRGASLVGLKPLDRSRAGLVVDGASPKEKAQALFDRHLRARLEERPGKGERA